MEVSNSETASYCHVLLDWIQNWDQETRDRVLLERMLQRKGNSVYFMRNWHITTLKLLILHFVSLVYPSYFNLTKIHFTSPSGTRKLFRVVTRVKRFMLITIP